MNKHLLLRFVPFWILTVGILAITITMIVFGKSTNIDLSYFSRDLNALAGNPWYFGTITFLCSFFWSFTVAICFFTFALLKNDRLKEAQLFKIIGIFTIILLIDDVFMIHEDIFPNYLSIPERVIYLIYFFIVIYVVKQYFNFIKKTNYIILFTAIFLLGTSAFFDILSNNVLPDKNFYEDVIKLFGTTFWFYYFFDTCYNAVKESWINISFKKHYLEKEKNSIPLK